MSPYKRNLNKIYVILSGVMIKIFKIKVIVINKKLIVLKAIEVSI